MIKNKSNSKRIAINTVFLYVRQLITMAVSLISTGIVMRELGVEDFGIYNVVGGVVVLFSILQGTLAVGTQRFLNYEMGKGNTDNVRDVFNISLRIYYLIAIVVIILSETIGLWYVSHKMIIPAERIIAVHWVYQVSIIMCVLSITQTPYTAAIIANEKMKIYGYLGVAESLFRLGLIFLLVIINSDKLILYALLNLFVSLLFRLMYRFYCLKKFPECKFCKPKNNSLYREILAFSGWSLLAKVSYVGRDQGGALMVNSFFGVFLNASIAVASSVSNAVSSFVSNFQMAYRPQLVKSYATGDIDSVFRLFFMSSKISAFLILLIGLPVIVNIDFLLNLWLGTVPEKSNLLILILMLDSFISALFAPFWMTIFAMGNIKKYQIMEGIIVLLNIPFMFLAFTIGLSIEWLYIIRVFLLISLFVYATTYLVKKIYFPFWNYLKKIIIPIAFVSTISILIVVVICNNFNGFSKLIISTSLCLFIFLPLFYFIVFSVYEKKQVNLILQNAINKIKKT